MMDVTHRNPQRQRQIEKHKGVLCCVCGKWGADDFLDVEHLHDLKMFAELASVTIRNPSADGIHKKCETKLRILLRYHGQTGVVL